MTTKTQFVALDPQGKRLGTVVECGSAAWREFSRPDVMINYTGSLGEGWTLATTRQAINLFVARVRAAYPHATIAINEKPGKPGHRRQFEMRVDDRSLGLTYDPETATLDDLKIGDIWNTTINELSL